MKKAIGFAMLLGAAAALTACGKHETAETPGETPRMAAPSNGLMKELAPSDWAHARADFVDPDGAKIGHAVLKSAPAGVLLRLDVLDLSEGWHGMHFHEVGDCSDGGAGFKASGGHVNPDGRAHGFDNPDGPERANLPNIYANADGRATAEFYASAVALSQTAETVAADLHNLIDDDGFAIIIHANPDDHITQPIGGSGARVACAAITEIADHE